MDKMGNMQGLFGMNPNMAISGDAFKNLQKNMLNAAGEEDGQDGGLDFLNISLFGGDEPGIDGDDYMLGGDFYGEADYEEAMARAEAAEAEMDDILAESELEGNEVVTEEKLGDLEDELGELEQEKEEKLKEQEELEAEQKRLEAELEAAKASGDQEKIEQLQGKLADVNGRLDEIGNYLNILNDSINNTRSDAEAASQLLADQKAAKQQAAQDKLGAAEDSLNAANADAAAANQAKANSADSAAKTRSSADQAQKAEQTIEQKAKAARQEANQKAAAASKADGDVAAAQSELSAAQSKMIQEEDGSEHPDQAAIAAAQAKLDAAQQAALQAHAEADAAARTAADLESQVSKKQGGSDQQQTAADKAQTKADDSGKAVESADKRVDTAQKKVDNAQQQVNRTNQNNTNRNAGNQNAAANNNGGGGGNNNAVNNNGGNNNGGNKTNAVNTNNNNSKAAAKNTDNANAAGNAQNKTDGSAAADGENSVKAANVERKPTDGSFIRDNPEPFYQQLEAQGWKMQKTEGTEFDAVLKRGDMQIGIKWGTGDSKGMEMYMHGCGSAPVSKPDRNPFAGYSLESDLIVVQTAHPSNWHIDQMYEVARPFLEQGYDMGVSGFSAGGYGAYVMTEYVMGLQGKNGTVPLQEGQHFTARFFDGLGSLKRMPAMLASSPDNFTAEFYNSNDKGFEISRGTRNVGRKLSQQFSNVKTGSYEFGAHNVHNNRSYCRHGMLEFTVPEVIPGCTKVN